MEKKEAIEIVRNNLPNSSYKRLREALEILIPELEESDNEDEKKLKESLMQYLWDMYHKDCYPPKPSIELCDKWVAWLEKQGKQKPQGKLVLEVWKDMRLEVYQQASGNRHEPNYSDDSTKMFSLNDIDEIIEKVAEKQCEQKTTNKIKPRFKVGDWIASARGTARIIGIGANDSEFLLEYTDGDQESLSIEYVNSTYTKWTIQRAWDGDVLISAYNHPFIYNGNNNSSYVGSYCGIETTGGFKISTEECHWTENINIHPATKEQQDYLFKKMGEAGYMWEGHTKKLVCK